jgi:hypothetical protein
MGLKGGRTPACEDEIELPPDLAESDGRHLRPERADSPIADAGSEGVSAAADLHGHDFRHVDPVPVSSANVMEATETYQLQGPKDQEKMMVTQKMKKTPPIL